MQLAYWSAANGVGALPKPSTAVITSRLNVATHAPRAVAVLLQREPEALAVDADDDVAQARPRVEPRV